jgi:SAM-dependent methyltransferase
MDNAPDGRETDATELTARGGSIVDLKARAKERMSRYSPNKFRDDAAFAKFFDWRCDTFSGDGEDMLLLEYPDLDTQERIFRHTLALADLRDRTILDVGCGLGYLKPYLDAHHAGYRSYQGVDLSARMIEGAQQRWGDHFVRRDVMAEPFTEGRYDYVTLLSVLGVKITDDPQAYIERLLTELFRIAGTGLLFTNLAPGRRKRALRSDFTIPPDEMASWCREHLSPHVEVDDTLELVTYSVAVTKEPG